MNNENEIHNEYPSDDLQPDSEGRYQWVYEIIQSANPSYRNTLMLIFALIILIPGFILLFMIYGRDIVSGSWDGAGIYLLILFVIFAAAELLVAGFCSFSEKIRGGSKSIPYEMDEEGITVYPGSRHVPYSYLHVSFSKVNDIRVKPEYDEIDLMDLLRVTQVYVYPEDRAFILNYIFDHLPEKAKILRRKEEYREYLK